MAQAKPRKLALDSGALIAAGKDQRAEAVIRKWLREGAELLIAAPAVAEVIRGGARDAVANRLINAVGNTIATNESIARRAGTILGSKNSSSTIDALIVATAESSGATDIMTSDPGDILLLSDGSMNIISL